jgi:hypothetical protein
METTELLHRYLHAVGFWLPRKQKQDIIAELSEDLHSQIEEKEAELGRKLSECDLEAMLKQRGRPVLVANHYLPQQYLIGPMLFPIYRFVLVIVTTFYLATWIVVALGLMIFNSAYRAEHVHGGWMKGVFSLWVAFWPAALFALGVITLVFAVLERVNAKSRFLEEWEPSELPAVRDPNQIPRSSSVVELTMLTAFCVWWIGYMSSPIVINRPDVRIVLSPVWQYFFWGFGLIALANIPISAVNLIRPYWTIVRASLRLVTDLAGSVMICLLLKAHLLVEVRVANVPTERTLTITKAINMWAERSLPIGLIAGVAILVYNVYRIVRLRKNAPEMDLSVKIPRVHAN